MTTNTFRESEEKLFDSEFPHEIYQFRQRELHDEFNDKELIEYAVRDIKTFLHESHKRLVEEAIAIVVNNSTPSNEQMKIVRELRGLINQMLN